MENAEKLVAEVKVPWGLNFYFCMSNSKIEPQNIAGSPVSFLKFATEIIEKSGEAILTEKNPHVLSGFLKTYRQSVIEDLEKIARTAENLEKMLLSDELKT